MVDKINNITLKIVINFVFRKSLKHIFVWVKNFEDKGFFSFQLGNNELKYDERHKLPIVTFYMIRNESSIRQIANTTICFNLNGGIMVLTEYFCKLNSIFYFFLWFLLFVL